MVVIPYEDIYSRFRLKITDFKMLSMDEDLLELMCQEWLMESVSNPRFRKMFSSFTADNVKKIISFELLYPVDDASDSYFITSLLSLTMAIQWLQPQVDSILNTAPMIGGKEEKKLLDNHKYSIQRLESMKTEQKKMIRDYGYMETFQMNKYLIKQKICIPKFTGF